MKVLVSEKILMELNISDKNQSRFMGAGDFQDVYISKFGDTVIKFPKNKFYDDLELEDYSFMKEYPKYFSNIYKVTKNYAVVEKLDSKAAKEDYLEIQKRFTPLLRRILLKFYEEPKKQAEEYKKELGGLFPKFKMFVNLIQNIAKVKGTKLGSSLDINEGNFGYDKNGTLKMIDI